MSTRTRRIKPAAATAAAPAPAGFNVAGIEADILARLKGFADVPKARQFAAESARLLAAAAITTTDPAEVARHAWTQLQQSGAIAAGETHARALRIYREVIDKLSRLIIAGAFAAV